MIFRKTYTRDTTIIIQEMWPYQLAHRIRAIIGETYPHQPVTIDYIEGGIIEIWENQESLEFTKDKLSVASFSQKKKILSVFKEYIQRPIQFKEQTLCENLTDLKAYLAGVEKYMLGDMLLSSFADYDSAEPEVSLVAKEMRATDHYFASNDQTIRASITKIYPEHAEYAICVRRNELDTPPSLEECKERFKHFVVASDGYAAVESRAVYAKKHPNIEFVEDTVTSRNEIAGEIAMGGKVTGPAKIVRRIAEMAKVQEGDILISPMTTPALLPAMQKAAAFVTDEGGVLCHAAVVAREMKKPCIINTKFATRVLKDGDMVEVDAEKGIVRKL